METWALSLATIAGTFILIFPSELPDKTFIATLVLSTRFRHLWVWLGVITAFAIQMVIAVAAGGLLSLLPSRLVLGVTFLLFVAGAIVLIKGGLTARGAELAAEAEEEAEIAEKVESAGGSSRARTFAVSFLVIFTAEWGDLSQILTAGIAARTGEPLSVFLGAWIAVAVVAGIGVLIGNWLRSRVPLWRVRLFSGAILLLLAGWTAIEFVNA